MGDKKQMTMKDLEEKDGDEKKQGYYAGGGKNSGQLILDGSDPKKVTSSVFEQAQRLGAVPAHEAPQASSSPGTFQGSGHTLTGDTNPSSTSPATPSRVTITFWANGFTVGEDTNLRLYEENRQFMESIMRGQVPRELWQQMGRQEVEVELKDCKEQTYTAPPQYFTGEGFAVGSATSSAGVVVDAPAQVTLDSSQPTIQVSIRLANGKRVVEKFNPSHTVGDVYTAAASHHNPGAFELNCTFPRKTLSDRSQNIVEAGLKGAAVNQTTC